MLRLQFLLPDLFPFDSIFDIESTQTGHSDLFVHELTMKQNTALFQSHSSPESECFMTKQKIKMLLIKFPTLSVFFMHRFLFKSTTANMLHRTIWQRKCFWNRSITTINQRFFVWTLSSKSSQQNGSTYLLLNKRVRTQFFHKILMVIELWKFKITCNQR